jgi:hypothetical protein
MQDRYNICSDTERIHDGIGSGNVTVGGRKGYLLNIQLTWRSRA